MWDTQNIYRDYKEATNAEMKSWMSYTFVPKTLI